MDYITNTKDDYLWTMEMPTPGCCVVWVNENGGYEITFNSKMDAVNWLKEKGLY